MCTILRAVISRGLLATVAVTATLTCHLGMAERATVSDQTSRRLLEVVAERGYHETALLILDRLAADPELSAEFRRTIPLRRAAALVASVRFDPDLAKRRQTYADAAAEIDRLLATGDDPAVVAEAAMQRGLLLLEQGRLRRLTDDSAGAAAAAKLFGKAAAAFVAGADAGPASGSARAATERELAAVDARLMEYRKRRVLPREDRRACDALEAERERLRGRLVQLDLLAAEATAEQARCFPTGSAARQSGLKRAAGQYRAIAEKQPTRAAGLWARVEEGRTLIELGERERGLELLDEILKLPATEILIERLQVRALAATLQCWLETPDQRDDAGFDERLRRQVLGLGPPERLDADALDAKYAAAELLLRRVEEIPPGEQRRRQPLVEDVRRLATDVARAGGDRAAPARELLERLDGRGRAAAQRLGQTFDAAVDRARQAVAAVQADPTAAGCAAACEQIRQALVAGVTDPPEDPAARRQQLLQLRYQLAFVLYEGRRYHEAAAVGEDFLVTAPAAPISRKAATIALASWQALQRQPNEAWGRVAVGRLARLTEVIMGRWPDEAESAAAAMLAIDLAAAAADRSAIETILAGLPPTSSGRAELLLRGGVAIWQLCGAAGEPTGVSAGAAAACAARAADRLDEGLGLIASEQTLAEPLASLAVAAAVARCQIALATDGAATNRLMPLLTQPLYGPWTLLRDPANTFSQQLVEAGLSCCLRGFTRAGRFDLAEEAVTELAERLAGDDAAGLRLAATAGVLGRGLFDRLQAPDAPAVTGRDQALQLLVRLLAVAASPSAPRAVTLWAAATLKRLGEAEGALEQLVPRDRRRDLLEQAAAATQRLLAAEPAAGRPPLRLQLAELWTAVGRWQAAVAELDLVVADPRAGRSILVQREVADLLESLARNQPDPAAARQLFRAAVAGRTVGSASAWGWGGLASRISRRAFAGDDAEARQLRRLYFEARHRLAGCRLAWARREADAATARRQLQQAAAELEIEARLHPDLGGKEFQQRFEQLREEIRQALSGPPGDDA